MSTIKTDTYTTEQLSGNHFQIFNFTNAHRIDLHVVRRQNEFVDLPHLVNINADIGPFLFHFSMSPEQARMAARKIIHLANVAEQYEIEATMAAERAQEVEG